MKRILLFLLLLSLSSCTQAEGKSLADFLQLMLQQESALRWLVCIMLVFIVLQTWRIVKRIVVLVFRALKGSWRFVFVWGKRRMFFIVLLGTLLWLLSNPLTDLIQDVEQRYLHPVWLNQYDRMNEEHQITIYEEELGKRIDPYQKQVVMRRTREIAAKIQSTPLAIYECAYLECGLYPFTVRRDRVAAGWIQFTRVGLGGLRYQGRPVAYEEVLKACDERNIEFMMDLTELYLVDKYERAGRRPLLNTIDLYLALFAPALIGAESQRIVYQGYNNPSYYLNDGLDGWYVGQDSPGGRRQIFRKSSQKDGKITIWEMFLALEAKKGRLISSYMDTGR